MHPRTLVTGGNGVVGRVLRRGLDGLPLTFTDHSQLDVSDPEGLRRALFGHDQVLHLASPVRGPAWAGEALMASVRMASAVLGAAQTAGVKRLVIPSSVLATSNVQLEGRTWVNVADAQAPDTEYGRTRIQIEDLGRAASRSGMEVVCVRLGAIRHPDYPPQWSLLRNHWLSHEDCVALFRACLAAPVVAGRFSLFYAVSDLPERVFDTANPFGWTPKTTSVGSRRTVVANIHRLNTGVRGRLRLRTRWKSMMGRVKG